MHPDLPVGLRGRLAETHRGERRGLPCYIQGQQILADQRSAVAGDLGVVTGGIELRNSRVRNRLRKRGLAWQTRKAARDSRSAVRKKLGRYMSRSGFAKGS